MFDDLPIFARDFLSYTETIKGKSINTVKEYYYDMRLFLRYIKKTKMFIKSEIDTIDILDVTIDTVKDITLSDLYLYMAYLSHDRKCSTSTRARKVASIKSLFRFLHKKARLIENDPANELETPKIKHRLPRYLDIDESTKLLQSIDGKHEIRDYAIITLFLNCGLRLSELVNINISNIKVDTLVVLGKGAKERTIYLNNACISVLSDYMNIRQKEGVKDKDALFLSERKSRISQKMVQYIVKKFIAQSGLDSRMYSTHKLRHTAATLMYKHGNVDIRTLREILGHECITTTEIYTHLDDKKLRDAVAKNPLGKIKTRRK